MNKAILVIDMPNSCDECPLFNNYYSDMCCRGLNYRRIDYPYPENVRQNWCPLKPVPHKQVEGGTWTLDGYVEDEFPVGWNACIEEILGE